MYMGDQMIGYTCVKCRYVMDCRPYVCHNCGNSYINCRSLKRHIKDECGQLPKYKCPHCPRRTKLHCNLLKHIQSHRRNRSMALRQIVGTLMDSGYTCQKCEKTYSSSSSLRRHLRLECGLPPQFHCFGASFIIGMVKKPYPCEDCHRSYKNKSSLNRHQQYECGNIRFIKCAICEKKLRKSSLPKHMMIHGI
ncbi:hypothetical protein PV325_010705 [Microctonus aethiopoides]|nr:hypothetical protein PV325_010705 [Microctonus aethiopoides]